MVSVMPFRIEGSRDESSNQSELLFLESDSIQYRKTNTVAVIIFIRLSSVIIDCSKSKWQGPINITRSLGQRCVVRDFVKIWCCISKGDLVGQANQQFLWVVTVSLGCNIWPCLQSSCWVGSTASQLTTWKKYWCRLQHERLKARVTHTRLEQPRGHLVLLHLTLSVLILGIWPHDII